MFEVKDPERIKADAMANLATDIDKREGSFSNDMAGPLALELHKMYDALHRIRPMVWVDETSGPYLDMAAEDLGLEPRKEGTHARVELLVTGETGYLLPADSVFLTADGRLFDTDEDATIPDEKSILVPATAREAGAASNVDSDTIVHRLSGDIRIRSVTNPEESKGGADPESDLSLYQRIVFARRRPATSGNRYHYEMWALEATAGVGAVRVFPLWNGNGTVKVLVADYDRQPVDDAIVAACAAHIEEQRPTTARVTVVSAEPLTVNIAASVQLQAGVSAEIVLERIRDSITAHFREISLQEYTVNYHWVGATLIGTEGVADYRGLRVNGRRASVAMTPEQIPVLGEVDIQWI